MIKIDKTNIDGVWVKFEEDETVEFKIKPFKNSVLSLRPDTNISNLAMQVASTTLVDWKGIKDQNDNDVPFNEENKLFVLDHAIKIVNFIYAKAIVIAADMINYSKKKI